MEKYIRAALLFILNLCIIISAGAVELEEQTGTELVLTPKVSDLGRSGSYIVQGKSLDDRIELVLPGRLYDPPLNVALVAKKKAARTTVKEAVASMYSAYKSDDREWILSGWLEHDMGKVSNILDNELMRRADRKFFSSKRIKEILGYVDYGDYKIVIVRYDGDNESTRLEAYKKVKEEWKATRLLSQDLTMDVLYSSIIKKAYFTRSRLDRLSRK